MKSVLMSVQPKWCELIASGKKTVEIRKTRPNLETPFKCYIYETKGKRKYFSQPLPIPYNEGTGKVIGEFVCDKVFPIRVFENGSIQDYMWHDMERSCVPYDDISSYIGNDKTGYGWHISDLVIYEKPRNWHDFYKSGALSMDELLDREELCSYCSDTDYGEHATYGTPNGPVFCEGSYCDSAYREYLDDNFALARPPQSWCYVQEVKP